MAQRTRVRCRCWRRLAARLGLTVDPRWQVLKPSSAISIIQSIPCQNHLHFLSTPFNVILFPDKQKSITSGDLKGLKSSGGGGGGGGGGGSVPKSSSSPTIIVSDGAGSNSSSKPVPFKPYEIAKEASRVESRKSSLNSSDGSGKALGGSPLLGRSPGARDGESNGRRDTTSPRTTSSSSETTPTLSSGMEILAGHPKDLPLGTYRPPVPGALDPLNPAFRLPGLGGLPGYPSTSSVAGSVCRDPYCKDPNCPTAVYNAYMARMSAARGGLPPGYLELMEAHKMAALGLGGLGSPNPPSVPTSLASSAALGPGGPYICNWMNGRDYCGKRFTSAEELLVHLKTHTNLSASDSGLLAGAANPSSAAAYANLLGASAASLMGRGGGGPVLPSSLGALGAAGRYSPYQRPGAAPLPPSLAGAAAAFPPSLAALHPSFASLAGYPASLYALYGARL